MKVILPWFYQDSLILYPFGDTSSNSIGPFELGPLQLNLKNEEMEIGTIKATLHEVDNKYTMTFGEISTGKNMQEYGFPLTFTYEGDLVQVDD